jgi:hypothetical protein
MPSWALFAYGRSKPPRTRRRRVLWACVVLGFCAGLAPFVLVGVVEQWVGGHGIGVLLMVLIAALLLFGVGAAIYAFIDVARTKKAKVGAPADYVR